jgi:radical SAM-linked protein
MCSEYICGASLRQVRVGYISSDLSLTWWMGQLYDRAVQRLRLRFSRGPELKYISHLDLMRLWERALRRGEIPLVYSEGYSPHPRISLAAPLSIGMTSEAELMDLTVDGSASAHSVMRGIRPQLPLGLEILEIWHALLTAPSLQSQLRYAEYRVEVPWENGGEEMRMAVDSLMHTRELPWRHMRDTGPRLYDLRALIGGIWLEEGDALTYVLGMRLRCGPQGTGRPEQVTAALGVKEHPLSIHRTKLLLAES